MTRDEHFQPIADLFRQTGTAHHQAFFESDGDDPEWPLWYAQQMKDELDRLLAAEITVSELVYVIVAAERVRPQAEDGADWATFYTRFLLAEYGG